MSVTPDPHDGAMVESAMRESLQTYINRGTPSERSLARFALELLDATRLHPGTIAILNRRALEAMDAA